MIGDAAFSLGSAPPGEPDQVAKARRSASRLRPIPRVNIQAFCEDQDTAAAIEQAAQDRRLSRARVSVQMGGVDGGLRLLSQRRHAQSHHHRIPARPRDHARGTRPPGRALRSRHQGHGRRPSQRRGALSRVAAPGRQRISGRSRRRAPDHRDSSSLYSDRKRGPSARPSPLSARRAARARAPFATTPRSPSPSSLEREVVIADFDLPFGTAGLDFNQDRRGIADALASPRRFDALKLDRLLSRCSDFLSLFAAPGTLDRPYDLDPRPARPCSTWCAKARHGSRSTCRISGRNGRKRW